MFIAPRTIPKVRINRRCDAVMALKIRHGLLQRAKKRGACDAQPCYAEYRYMCEEEDCKSRAKVVKYGAGEEVEMRWDAGC